MAKKTKMTLELFNPEKGDQKMVTRSLGDYCREIMMIYGGNVNVIRQIPDLRDGCKPVERRILFGMYVDENLNTTSKPYKKCGKIVGTVLGKYHPHGDLTVYGSLASLAQPWKNYPMLVQGQGNFGNINGDSPAAMRYTEAKNCQFVLDAFFSDWGKNITDFKENYTGEYEEPEFLPSKYPTILFRGTFGLGYGAYTRIPAFNVIEACDLVIELIKHPNKKDVYLIPDFPHECDIIETDFKQICEVGEGKITIRGHLEVTEHGTLMLTSIPYMTDVKSIIENIKILKEKGKLNFIKNMNELSERGNIQIEIELKKGMNPESAKDILYKLTYLQKTYGYSFELINDYENYHYNLKSLIMDWIEFARDTKKRTYLLDYNKKNGEYHMVTAMIDIIKKDGAKTLIKISQDAHNRKEIIARLIESGFTDLQAETLVDTRMHQLSKDSIKGLIEREEKLRAEIAELYEVISDPTSLDKAIIEDLRYCKKKYGRERICKVIESTDKIADTNHTIVVTQKGLYKKMDIESTLGAISKDDKCIFKHNNLSNLDSLIIFTKQGKVYEVKISDLVDCTKEVDGFAFESDLIKNVVKVIPRSELTFDDNEFLIMITEKGMIKKSLSGNYKKITTRLGVRSMGLKAGDSVIDIMPLQKESDLIIYTTKGHGIRFNTRELSCTLRASQGVKCLKLEDAGDLMCGITRVNKNTDTIVMVTSQGNMKKCPVDSFDGMNRAGNGLILTSVSTDEDLSKVYSIPSRIKEVTVETSRQSYTINLSDIPQLARKAPCKAVIQFRKTEYLY